MNTTLHQQLINACTLFNTALKYEERVSALEAEIKKYENKYQQMKKRGFRATPGVLRIIFIGGGVIILPLVAVAAFLSTIPAEQVEGILADQVDLAVLGVVAYYVGIGVSMVVPLLLVGASLLYKFTYCKAKTKALQKEAQKYWDGVGAPTCEKIREQIRALRQEQEDYVRKNFDFVSFIPEAYRKPDVVSFMEQAVRNGRADSLKEAINLYEEQLHRWALQRQAERIAEETEWQAYNVRRQLIELQELQEKIKY